MANNSDVKVNITTWFDGKGLTAAERELRRAYKMQQSAANEMAAAEAKASAARKEALNSAANTMLGVGVAMTAFAGLAVAKFAQFDQAMSNVAASGQDAKDNLSALKDAALEAGARTAYSATEAAGAIEELAKAGMGVTDILNGGLNGALDLAAAGQLDVAQAAELTATTLKVFGLEGDKAAHVADLLSAGANKAQGSVSDMGLALSYVGQSAAGLGVSVEETAGTLALLASNGILAEKAGTGLRGVIMALTAPSKAASAAMAECGINVFDASGNFIGLAGVAEQLHANLYELDEATRTAALGQIFGNEQINVARVLYKDGADAVDEWTAAVDDQGNATRTAAERMNNLRGDIEELGGSWETLLIKTGEGADGPLRSMVQGVTSVVNALGEMPPAAQTALLAIVGGGGLVLLGVGGMIKLVTAISEAKLAMQTLGWTAKATSATVGLVGGSLGIAALGLMAWADNAAEARARTQALADSLDAVTGAITANTREQVKNQLAVETGWWIFKADSVYDSAAKIGVGMDVITDAALGSADAMRQVQDAIDAGNAAVEEGGAAGWDAYAESIGQAGLSSADWAGAVQNINDRLSEQNGALIDARRQTQQKASADDESAESAGAAAEATEGATGAYTEQEQAIRDLIDALDALNGANQSREQAEINWSKQMGETNSQIGESTDLTLENRQAMLDMAQAAGDLAQARLEQTGSEENFRDTLDQARDALFQQARQFFDTDEEAQAYVDTLLQVPEDVTTTVNTPGLDDATLRAQALQRILAELDGSTSTVTVFNRTINTSNGVAISGPQGQMRVSNDADGSIKFYGSGGYENHVAQIAPANTIRVWAEPETGGEAYIPLAPSKRARSLGILEEVADRFGVPLGGRSGGGGVTVNVTADPRFAERQARLIVRSMRDAQASHRPAWGVI